MKKQILTLLICIAFNLIPAFGQQTEAERVSQERERAVVDRRIQEQERSLMEQTNKVFRDESLRRGVYRRKSREKPLSEKELKEELRKIELLRAPNPEDSVKYQDFLRQPKTGLFRLFPDLGCDSKLLVQVDDDCADAIPYGWSYSFRKKDYSYDFLFDIRLKDNNLISDSFHSQSILVDLGDVPLKEISITDDAMKFLIEFKPETRLNEARNQFLQITQGITSANRLYAKNVKAKENTTYAARFIAYQRQSLPSSKIAGLSKDITQYEKLKYDERIDLTIAFRVVRKEKDGDITILWRELKRQKSPKIIFGKDNQLSDVKQ